MPRHVHRSRRTPLALQTVIAVTIIAVVGTIVAGRVLAPGSLAPTGIVADEVHVVATPAASRAGSAEAAPLHQNPDSGGAPPGGAPPGGAPPAAGLTGYRWPIAHPRVTLPFGPTGWGEWFVHGERFHDGLDLATFCGDRVVAAHDGTVIAAGRHFDETMGWIGDLSAYYARLDAKKLWPTLPIVVVIDDGNAFRSVYAHFGRITVKDGQAVHAGDLLGYEGRTGHASGCHLHYGLFSPFETAVYTTDPANVKRMKLPNAEIARLDPLTVLPPRPKPAPKPSPRPSGLTP